MDSITQTPVPVWLVPGTKDWDKQVARNGLAEMQERRAVWFARQCLPGINGNPQERMQPPMKIVNGVITDSHLCCMWQGRLAKLAHPYQVRHVGDLLQICLDYGLQTVWVLAGTDLSARATREFIEGSSPTWNTKGVSYTSGPKGHIPMCKFLRAWKSQNARADSESARDVCIGFAEHNDRWDLDGITHPVILLATITYLEDALDTPIEFSPNHVGMYLMQRENTKQRKEWTRPVRMIDYPPAANTGVSGISWKRVLTEDELFMLGIVAYDKNGMYSASCTGVLLGSGEPTHITCPTFHTKESELQPGVWRCQISGSSPFNGRELPHPTDGVTRGWFWTYTVKLLLELGYNVEISEAWVWDHKESHTILRPWAESLWQARLSLKTNTERYTNRQARVYAYEASKEVANQGMGLLDHKPDHPDWKGAYDWYRPDWYALLKDNARYQMFWRIRKYLGLGFTPVGIHEDCLYYVTNDPTPETALPGMMDRRDKLGGYKVKYAHVQVIPMEVAAPLFNDPGMDMGQVNSIFNAYDRQHRAIEE
jgi:hypothetical protein